MTGDPIPIAPTAHLVVTKGVCCVMAFGTGVGGAVKGYSQPVAQTAPELLVLKVKTQRRRWNAVEPVASVRQGR